MTIASEYGADRQCTNCHGYSFYRVRQTEEPYEEEIYCADCNDGPYYDIPEDQIVL